MRSTPKVQAIGPDHATITATSPAPRVGKHYSFFSTREILATLEAAGWVYDSGSARKTRRPEDQGYAHHVLRLSHRDLPTFVDGTRPQIVVVNNHLGAGSLRVCAGAFRVACANGLVIASTHLEEVRVRHAHTLLDDVLLASQHLAFRIPHLIDRVNRWTEQVLPIDQALSLAERCGRARWGAGAVFNAEDLLLPRRRDDAGNDLWRTFNVVQECVTQGGVFVRKNSEAPLRRTPMVRGALAQYALNRSLWEVAESFAA
jgi:hypothetical protein